MQRHQTNRDLSQTGLRPPPHASRTGGQHAQRGLHGFHTLGRSGGVDQDRALGQRGLGLRQHGVGGLCALVQGQRVDAIAEQIGRSGAATKEYLSQCRKKILPFIAHCAALLDAWATSLRQQPAEAMRRFFVPSMKVDALAAAIAAWRAQLTHWPLR